MPTSVSVHIVAVVAAVLLDVGGAPASAQRPESVDSTPRWPSRWRGAMVVPGQVIAVDPQRGTATVATEGGAVMSGLSSRALPGVAPGDRVDVQLMPSGR